jgi:hypothetical protein
MLSFREKDFFLNVRPCNNLSLFHGFIAAASAPAAIYPRAAAAAAMLTD